METISRQTDDRARDFLLSVSNSGVAGRTSQGLWNPDGHELEMWSFTYREYDYLNNARQTPKLPDWAVVDIRTPVSSRYPGKIEAAGFFDEAWQFKTASGVQK